MPPPFGYDSQADRALRKNRIDKMNSKCYYRIISSKRYASEELRCPMKRTTFTYIAMFLIVVLLLLPLLIHFAHLWQIEHS